MIKRTIAIADDHNLFRKGLISLLKKYKEIDVICEAPNGKALLDCIKQKRPEVVLLNVQMPVMNGIETLGFIRKKYPDIKVIILSGRKEEKFIYQLMELGAHAFVNKDSEMEGVVDAIHAVMEKGFFLNDLSQKAMANGMMKSKKDNNPAAACFSAREKDVIKLICGQKTIKEIADVLCLSPRTVDTYRENIFQKTGAKNAVGVVLYAIQHKLFDIQVINPY